MSYYLGIDIGTFASKGVLVDGDGRVVASATRPHQMLVPRPGWAEHRVLEDWWADFTAITAALLTESGIAPSAIRAIGTSAIGPCLVAVDAAGAPLMNAILYGVDTRAAAEIAELTAAIGEEVLVERCGNALTSQSIGPKILWLKRHRPEVFAAAHKLIGATSWLVHRLTGRFVVDHYSAANMTPLYLADTTTWSADLAPDLVGPEKLPDLAWTTDIAGTLTPAAAAETGLVAGTPVIVGTIDAAAEAVSTGVTEPGDLMLMYGSTMFMIMPTRTRLRDARLWYAPWLFRGQHAAMAGLSTSGTLTHWFRDQFARELDPETAIPTLAAEAAASPPGAKGLVLLPYFSGERTPIHDPLAKGTLIGLDLTHTRGDIYRALLEGIAYGTAHVIDTYDEAGAPPVRIFAVGGGTNNPVWSQAISDVAARAQLICEVTVGASYGDAFLAALAMGDAKRSDIGLWNPVERRVVPDPATANVYRRGYGVFKALYPATRDLVGRLGAPDAGA